MGEATLNRLRETLSYLVELDFVMGSQGTVKIRRQSLQVMIDDLKAVLRDVEGGRPPSSTSSGTPSPPPGDPATTTTADVAAAVEKMRKNAAQRHEQAHRKLAQERAEAAAADSQFAHHAMKALLGKPPPAPSSSMTATLLDELVQQPQLLSQLRKLLEAPPDPIPTAPSSSTLSPPREEGPR